MNATHYQDLLLPFGEAIGSPFWIFQQDNASIHVANSTWEWFLQNGVHGMACKFVGSESHGEPLRQGFQPFEFEGQFTSFI